MEFLYFTVAGLVLYVAADWVLLRIEGIYGKVLPNRSLFFFGIILVMTLVTFEAIQYFTPDTPPAEVQQESDIGVESLPEKRGPSADDPVQMVPSLNQPANNQ
ncbi:MAG: hypothetical protein HQL72_13640 [Magnetococcales bacterium]|nr:hypothetical protein [Magnetococcales bacterium]